MKVTVHSAGAAPAAHRGGLGDGPGDRAVGDRDLADAPALQFCQECHRIPTCRRRYSPRIPPVGHRGRLFVADADVAVQGLDADRAPPCPSRKRSSLPGRTRWCAPASGRSSCGCRVEARHVELRADRPRVEAHVAADALEIHPGVSREPARTPRSPLVERRRERLASPSETVKLPLTVLPLTSPRRA